MPRLPRMTVTDRLILCDWCGKLCTVKRSDARFCSAACRQQHHKHPGIVAGPRPVSARRPRFDAFTFIG